MQPQADLIAALQALIPHAEQAAANAIWPSLAAEIREEVAAARELIAAAGR